MKAHMLRIKAFALIALISFSFVACSDDDNDDDEKSFLEAHGGTVWKFGEPEDGLSVYSKINSSITNPFEIWLYNVEGECYRYESITDEGSPEVIENRENKVQIRIGGNTGNYGDLTMTISGDVLRVELDNYEDGVLVDSEKFILQRTSDSTDALEICAS
jgi:hypothetical protein